MTVKVRLVLNGGLPGLEGVQAVINKLATAVTFEPAAIERESWRLVPRNSEYVAIFCLATTSAPAKR